MYEIWLMLNIVYELALEVWPWLLALALLWLLLMARAWRRGGAAWRASLPGADPACIETHASWVLLAGDVAWKIKKPLKLDFLDFSTLALRRAACEEELRINRRTAPQLYLGVVPITGTPQAPRLGGAGPAIEYAVHMRRFDRAAEGTQLAERGLARVEQFFALLNRRLSGRAFIATERFSAADITAVVAVDFARIVKRKPLEQHAELLRWRVAMAGRPSMAL